MNKNISISALVGAGATAGVVLIVQLFIGATKDTLDEGSEAIETAKAAEMIDQIEDLMADRDKVVVDGRTMTTAEALSMIATDQAIMREQMKALID